MNKMIAFCGLDCEQCEARIATINNDNNLRKKSPTNGAKRITPKSDKNS